MPEGNRTTLADVLLPILGGIAGMSPYLSRALAGASAVANDRQARKDRAAEQAAQQQKEARAMQAEAAERAVEQERNAVLSQALLASISPKSAAGDADPAAAILRALATTDPAHAVAPAVTYIQQSREPDREGQRAAAEAAERAEKEKRSAALRDALLAGLPGVPKEGGGDPVASTLRALVTADPERYAGPTLSHVAGQAEDRKRAAEEFEGRMTLGEALREAQGERKQQESKTRAAIQKEIESHQDAVDKILTSEAYQSALEEKAESPDRAAAMEEVIKRHRAAVAALEAQLGGGGRPGKPREGRAVKYVRGPDGALRPQGSGGTF